MAHGPLHPGGGGRGSESQKGFHFDTAESLFPLGFLLLLFAVLSYLPLATRGEHRARAGALTQVLLFSWGFVVLMYVGGTVGRPYIDRPLMHCDALLGFSLPRLLQRLKDWPIANKLLGLAYDSLLLQTAGVIGILGLRGDRRPLQRFLLQFMVCAWVTWLVFLAFPAEGPFWDTASRPPAHKRTTWNTCMPCERADLRISAFAGTEGLITFPSFHTTWALLLAMAYFRRPLLFVPFALLNLAVILATLTTGWHYLSDVLAGLVVYLAVWLATCRLRG